MKHPRRIAGILAVAGMCLFAPAAAQEDEPVEPNKPSIPDAVRLFSLDQLTVVYPAGAGEDVEVNRRSASFRAAYLKSRYKVDAQVAADDALTDAQKRGNLMVLGWNNRVLGGPEAQRIFEKRERGFTFQGLEENDPSANLMFMTYSPFQFPKFLFFWSRIDPEMDRFQPVPFVGSNWAILRDFLIVRQGMFLPEYAWPPERNVNGEADRTELLLEIESERRIRRSDHYDVYYLATSDLDRDLDAIVRARESAYAKAVALLGSPPEGFRIRLFLYIDPADKKERSGVEDPAHSVPAKRDLHLVRRLALNAAPHEEIHVVARQRLGPAYLTAMYEGLALSEDGVYDGTDLDLLGAVLSERGQMPSLDELFDEARMRALPNDAGFPASGLALRFLRETAGDAGIAEAYGLPYDAGIEGLAGALGKDPGWLRTAWSRWTKQRAASRKADLKFLKYQAEAQERYAAADYVGVATALEKALRSKAGDPQTLFNLAAARVRTGEYEKAAKILRGLSTRTLPPQEFHLVAFSHFQLGRVYDLQGRRDDALAEYRAVLALPNARDSHRVATEALERPFTRDQLD